MRGELRHFLEWIPTKGLHVFEFLAASLFISPVTHFIYKYIFDDKEFIVSLSVLIAIDTALALIYHVKKKTLSSNGFSKFFFKIIIYAAFLIIIHTGTHLNIRGEAIGLLTWMDSLGYTAIFVREALSIIEKAEKLRPGTIPTWITKRLKDFDDDGKINQE